MASEDLERLLRWAAFGGTWWLLERRPGLAEIALLTCSGEEMGRLRSAEPDVAGYVGEASAAEDARRG